MGVALYKDTGDARHLERTWETMNKRYPGNNWTKSICLVIRGVHASVPARQMRQTSQDCFSYDALDYKGLCPLLYKALLIKSAPSETDLYSIRRKAEPALKESASLNAYAKRTNSVRQQ